MNASSSPCYSTSHPAPFTPAFFVLHVKFHRLRDSSFYPPHFNASYSLSITSLEVLVLLLFYFVWFGLVFDSLSPGCIWISRSLPNSIATVKTGQSHLSHDQTMRNSDYTCDWTLVPNKTTICSFPLRLKSFSHEGHVHSVRPLQAHQLFQLNRCVSLLQ